MCRNVNTNFKFLPNNTFIFIEMKVDMPSCQRSLYYYRCHMLSMPNTPKQCVPTAAWVSTHMYVYVVFTLTPQLRNVPRVNIPSQIYYKAENFGMFRCKSNQFETAVSCVWEHSCNLCAMQSWIRCILKISDRFVVYPSPTGAHAHSTLSLNRRS